MGEIVTISNTLTIAANTSTKYSLYRVPPAQKATLRKVTVHFPPGTENKLQVAVYRGMEQVVPSEGYLQGEDTTIVIETLREYMSDQLIEVYAKNNDSTYSHTFTIILEIEIERGGG